MKAPPATISQDILDDIAHAQQLYDDGDWDGAEPIVRKLLRHGFAQPITYDALASILQFQGNKMDLALDCYRKALAIDPSYIEALNRLILVLDVLPDTTAKQAQKQRQKWWAQFGEPLYRDRRPHDNDKDPDRPLRVGYVSGDYIFHSAAAVFHRVVTRHSDAVLPFFYSATPHDKYHSITNTYRALPGWRDCVGRPDWAVADLIRRDAIDILVDLSGYTAYNQLQVFAMKPAPIQLTGWGYATGVGWPAMDGLLSDAIVIPPERRHEHIERIVELPCIITYEGPAELPGPNPAPCLTGPPVFGAFHRSLKINDEVLAVWLQLLQRVPDARLILKSQYCQSFVDWMRRRLAPVIDRVDILGSTGHEEHMLMFQQVDLFLDTWPQTGGVTTCEAAWMGVPTVTLTGPRVIQRTSHSINHVLGLDAFITETPEQYIEKAASCVTGWRSELNDLRQDLRRIFQASPIMAGYTEAVEAAYRQLWRAWCAKPVSLQDARQRLAMVLASRGPQSKIRRHHPNVPH